MKPTPLLPCSYRTCTRRAAWILHADGPDGLYGAGSCDTHRDQMATRALRRTGAAVVDWTPVRDAPPPPQNDAAPLF